MNLMNQTLIAHRCSPKIKNQNISINEILSIYLKVFLTVLLIVECILLCTNLKLNFRACLFDSTHNLLSHNATYAYLARV